VEQVPLTQLAELWLDGAAPTEEDLRAAKGIAAKLTGFEGLKPFPVVVQRLIEYVSTPDFGLDHVRKLVESDPALAARIMRVANSAAYRAYDACTSIGGAVTRIGAKGVVELSMAMAAMGIFKDLGGTGLKLRDHSAGTAAIGRELVFRLLPSNPSSKLFLVGLLHDIGKLLLIQAGDQRYIELVSAEPASDTLLLKEREYLGFDHAQLGAHVLRAWNLPQPIPQIIACHHQSVTRKASSPVLAQAMDFLRIADKLDWLIDRGTLLESPQLTQLLESPEAVRSGFIQAQLERLWDDLTRVRQEAISMFRR
jgi:putative nucleotidyltransferase with HDIG domain